MTVQDAGLARFNALPGDEAEAALRACCAAPDWAGAMLAARPYPDVDAALARGADLLAGLDWAGVRTALDAHPRIGERLAGGGREASWSATEQSGMDSATAETRAALVAANEAYEQRFGHVFLIFATGRSDVEMLQAARQRVTHDEATERAVVRTELGKIVALRLARLLQGAS